jgi:hypothetical protein
MTNTPLQALTLLNDPIYVEAARKLADRAFHEGGSTPDDRLSYMFRLATGRQPTVQEHAVLRRTYDKLLVDYQRDEKGASALLSATSVPLTASIPVAELAATAAVANMVLNMDEVITKG